MSQTPSSTVFEQLSENLETGVARLLENTTADESDETLSATAAEQA